MAMLSSTAQFGRDVLKDIVKEAVREEMEDREQRSTPSRTRTGSGIAGRLLLLLGIGALLGAVLARKTSKSRVPDRFNRKGQSAEPVQPSSDSDPETTERAGATSIGEPSSTDE